MASHCTDASILYKLLINECASVLRGEGFRRSDRRFYLKEGRNWGLLHFQKSGKSTKKRVLFTLNIGICSGRLLAFFSPYFARRVPLIEECHWRDRIGHFLAVKDDTWWTLTDQDSLGCTSIEVRRCILEAAVPAIKRRLSDCQLYAEWMNGKYKGATETDRLLYLCVLQKQRGEENALSTTREKLEEFVSNRPSRFVVKRYLRKLDSL